jgi:predicted nucleic acid-binding protein
MDYLDTSVIVALLTGKPSVARIRPWLNQSAMPPLTVFDWTLAEISSALSSKLRARQISAAAFETARIEFGWLLGSTFNLVAVERRHVLAAATHCTHHHLNLRSGDALHLAVALDIGAGIVTLDRRFSAAVTALASPCTFL